MGADKYKFSKKVIQYLQGWELAHALIAHSLICSDRSDQMSDCERFAQIAQDKWATVSKFAQVAHDKWVTLSDLLRLLMINKRMIESLVFLSKSLIHFIAQKKTSNLLKKLD